MSHPRALPLFLLASWLTSAQPGIAQLSSISEEYLAPADLIARGNVARVQQVGRGVVLVHVQPSHFLKGKARTRDPLSVFVYASFGYEESEQELVFFLSKRGAGYHMLESFPLEADGTGEGHDRLVALEHILAWELSAEPLEARVAGVLAGHLAAVQQGAGWLCWNAVRELDWLLARYPDSFAANMVEELDAAADRIAEDGTQPDLVRELARVTNRLRRALLLPVPPERLLLERSSEARRPRRGSAPPELRGDDERPVRRPQEPKAGDFDFGDEGGSQDGGLASLVPGAPAPRRHRPAPAPVSGATRRGSTTENGAVDFEDAEEGDAGPRAAGRRDIWLPYDRGDPEAGTEEEATEGAEETDAAPGFPLPYEEDDAEDIAGEPQRGDRAVDPDGGSVYLPYGDEDETATTEEEAGPTEPVTAPERPRRADVLDPFAETDVEDFLDLDASAEPEDEEAAGKEPTADEGEPEGEPVADHASAPGRRSLPWQPSYLDRGRPPAEAGPQPESAAAAASEESSPPHDVARDEAWLLEGDGVDAATLAASRLVSGASDRRKPAPATEGAPANPAPGRSGLAATGPDDQPKPRRRQPPTDPDTPLPYDPEEDFSAADAGGYEVPPPDAPARASSDPRNAPASGAVDFDAFYQDFVRAADDSQRAAMIAGLRELAPGFDRAALAGTLRAALAEQSPRIKQEAVRTIEAFALREAGVEVRELARDGTLNDSLRLDAVRTLGRLRDPGSLKLLEALTGSGRLSQEALTALRRIGEEHAEALEVLKDVRARYAGKSAADRRMRKEIDFLLSPDFHAAEQDLDKARRTRR